MLPSLGQASPLKPYLRTRTQNKLPTFPVTVRLRASPLERVAPWRGTGWPPGFFGCGDVRFGFGRLEGSTLLSDA